MGSGATAKYALPYPVPTDNPDIEGDMEALANAIDAILAPYSQDLIANRPAAGKAGRTFTETAASTGLPGTTWRDDGAAWRAVGSRVQPNAIGDVGAIVRAMIGQTADLTQWQDSAGAVLASIDKTGVYNITGVAYVGGNADPTTLLRARSAAQRPLLVQGAASQTADLQQWQSSTGAVKAYVDASGVVHSGSSWINGGNTGFPALMAVGAGTSPVTAVVKMMVGQSGDLQQWQDSSGGVFGGVTNQGFGYFGPSSPGGMVGINIPTASFRGLVVQGAASQSGDLAAFYTSTGTLAGRITANGGFHGRYDAGMLSGSLPGTSNSASQGATNNWGLIVKKFPAAVTDVFGVVDDVNATMFSVRADGLTGNAANGNYFNAVASNGATMLTSAKATGQVAHIVRGILGQTADLQEWQDSTNATLARITANGSLVGPVAAPRSAIGSAGVLSLVALALSPGTGETTVVPLVSRGLSAQSGDLQQWQNNLGTALAKVSSAGDFTAASLTSTVMRAVSSRVLTSESTASAVYVALTTADSVTLTVPPSGVIKISFAAQASNNTVGGLSIQTPVIVDNTSSTTPLAASDNDCAVFLAATANQGATVGRTFTFSGLTAGHSITVSLQYRSTGGTGTWQRRQLTVTPSP